MTEIKNIHLMLGGEKIPMIALKLEPKISFRTKIRIQRIVSEEDAVLKKISDTEVNILQNKDKEDLFNILYKLVLFKNSGLKSKMHNIICQGDKKIILQKPKQTIHNALEEMKDIIFLTSAYNAIYEEASPQVAFIYCPNKVTQMNLFAELGMYFV